VLGQPHHCAYLVDDIEATVRRLVDQLGAGPFFLIENVPLEDVVSRGEPAEFAHDSAFGYCGESAIELMQVRSVAPARVETGFSGARPRVHHVGYVVAAAEVADLRRSLDDRGLAEYLSSQIGGAETTLHDASALLGHDIEIHGENDGLRGFFAMVRAGADGWDGSDPLRPVGG
jgi:hypothetical protein